MVKSELVKIISEKLNISHQKTEDAVEAFFDLLTQALATGKRVELRGFGSFSSREYASYIGRNPKTGEPVNVAPKILPFYKMGRELKNAINK